MSNTTISFANSIPEQYEQLLGPFIFEPFAQELAARVWNIPAQAILELACGTGRLTRQLVAELEEGATITATDIDTGMLSIAKNNLDDPQVLWGTADMMALPFGNGEFDLVISQFGLMFPADKAAVIKEARRVLRDGGQLVFNTWAPVEENQLFALFGQEILSVLGDGVSGPISQMFSMSDERQVMGLLEANGFGNVSAHRVRLTAQIENAAMAAKGLIEGAPVFQLIRQKAPQALTGLLEQVEKSIAAAFGNHPVKVPLSAWVYEAKAERPVS
jgi:SAM-dependent methyltransferase